METFGQSHYRLQRKFWQIFGQSFHAYDQQGRAVLYSKLKAFKLKEDIRIYADESMSSELLIIHARNIFDFGATYDVLDAQANKRLGALRRVAIASMFGRDTWKILDAEDREIGEITEDSLGLALLRKYLLGALVPQVYHGQINNQAVLVFKQYFNLIIQKMDLDFSADPSCLLNRRLGVAAAILIMAIEGRQSD